MSRSLTPRSTLESLRKEAKRWLKLLRDGDPQSRARLIAASPAAPAEPGLRDVQLALAREYGHAGWNALKQALNDVEEARKTHAERVDRVLRGIAWGADRHAAARVLARWPEIATDNLCAAVSTGHLAEVRRRLATDPAAAARPGGPLGWAPLLYLAYARLPGGEDNAVEIASALLDAGADPNAAWDDGWGNPFKVLTGVLGAGEQSLPPHPQARALAELLIERGADPYDSQALYNTSLAGDDTSWLERLWAGSERHGRTDAWRARREPGKGIGGRLAVNALDYLLGNAVGADHRQRVDWLLAHGADANSPHAYSGRCLRDEALIHGFEAIAELLARHGATMAPLAGADAFRAACMRLDRAAAEALAKQHPRSLADPEPMLSASRQGRADVVALLLALCVSVDVADATGLRALQAAVPGGHLELVRLLLAHGAEVDQPTTQYDGAMGFAAHFARHEIAALMAPLSRDVHNMTQLGLKQRLAELFAVEPGLVNARHFRSGLTPLFMLAPDEDDAVDMAVFLLEHGADPGVVDRQGATPEAALRNRGLDETADFLRDESAAWTRRRN